MNLCDEINKLLESKSLIPKVYTDSDILMDIIKQEIETMKYEIESSIRGRRGSVPDPDDSLRRITSVTKSTFPPYLQKIFNNQGTRKKFLSAVERGKGKVWERIALEAIERLEHGYKNSHGYNEPDEEFLDELENPTPF